MISQVTDRLSHAGLSLRVLTQAGVIRPMSPPVLVGLARAVARFGTGPAGGFAALSARFGKRVGLIDEAGELTFKQIHERSNAVARGLAELGLEDDDSVAILCRNHRYFLEGTIGAAKVGADILFLNTAFAAPQLAEVLEREDPRVLIYDEEFTELVSKAEVKHKLLGWTEKKSDAESDEVGGVRTLGSLAAKLSRDDVDPPEHHSRLVILTSGTTGTPKGAPRNEAGIDAAVAMLERVPLRSRTNTYVAAPLFHTWGLAHLLLAMLLGNTVVLRRTFDAEQALEVIEENSVDTMVVIPVMLQRILGLDDKVLDKADTSSLRVVTSSGSALPGGLPAKWMDRFGDNLYSTYGSTEVAYAAIATPADLRKDPSTAGKPPVGTEVRIYDDNDKQVSDGEPGRIFVGNKLLFEGYTGGGSKDSIDGLMASGDVGRIDSGGRIVIEGRDDEMIVSGGENVFPKEVEDCISELDGVSEVAAVGVDDEDYGKRLRAFVVKKDDGLSEDDVKKHVKEQLARYKVPRDIEFLDELPRNATGKILKRELAEKD